MRSRSKFRNVRTNGFSSKREANRAAELQLLEKIDQIKELRYQVAYILAEKNEIDRRTLSYVADFVYYEFADNNWRLIVEDCKGFKPYEYRIKKRWLWEKFGIRIRET